MVSLTVSETHICCLQCGEPYNIRDGFFPPHGKTGDASPSPSLHSHSATTAMLSFMDRSVDQWKKEMKRTRHAHIAYRVSNKPVSPDLCKRFPSLVTSAIFISLYPWQPLFLCYHLSLQPRSSIHLTFTAIWNVTFDSVTLPFYLFNNQQHSRSLAIPLIHHFNEKV